MNMDKHMPQDALSFIHRLQEYGVFGYAWILLVSFWAGTAKYLSSLNGQNPTFLGWLTEMCVSGFVGIIAAMTCQYYQLDFLLTSAITGICAHNGTRSLYLIGEIFKKNMTNLNRIANEPLIHAVSMSKEKKQDDQSQVSLSKIKAGYIWMDNIMKSGKKRLSISSRFISIDDVKIKIKPFLLFLSAISFVLIIAIYAAF